ncbi:hypothetical protein [Saprospira grandis]|uniref:Uncharacterized protein n=1 Tax=Saprospira grandis (strain Lewin) TaxID=984262 RepID=H6L8H0_SAPGL|nr:hypothetical protein [Saprospira grandis]AFC26695.1 hypothetical protein SGRA_3980 [Saprospira grandis str. Lewin]
MKELLENPVLAPFAADFSLVEEARGKGIIEYFHLAQIKNYQATSYLGNIAWDTFETAHSLEWDLLDLEDIEARLKKSSLSEHEEVFLQLSYGEPILKISTSSFIAHWYEILYQSVEGFPLATADGKLFLEWLNNPKSIYANFLI